MNVFVAKDVDFISENGEVLIESIAQELIDSVGNYYFLIYLQAYDSVSEILGVDKYAKIIEESSDDGVPNIENGFITITRPLEKNFALRIGNYGNGTL